MNKKQKTMLARILAAAALLVALHFLPLTGAVRFVAYLIPYLVVGYDILLKAGRHPPNRQVFGECFLMAVATVGAIVLALRGQRGVHRGHRRDALLPGGGVVPELRRGQEPPEHQRSMVPPRLCQRVEQDGQLVPDGPRRGDHRHRLVVSLGKGSHRRGGGGGNLHPGHRRPHRESLPGHPAWEEIISGCINLTGLLKVRTTKEFGESTVSKILDLVENASSRKSVGGLHHPLCLSVYPCSVSPPWLWPSCRPGADGALGLAPLWGIGSTGPSLSW